MENILYDTHTEDDLFDKGLIETKFVNYVVFFINSLLIHSNHMLLDRKSVENSKNVYTNRCLGLIHGNFHVKR